MAIRVVEQFEEVDVEHKQSKLVARAREPRRFGIERLFQSTAIAKTL